MTFILLLWLYDIAYNAIFSGHGSNVLMFTGAEQMIVAWLVDLQKCLFNGRRFTMKNDGNIIKQITYLFTFELPSISQQINIGPYKMEVAQYIPTSTRCFQC